MKKYYEAYDQRYRQVHERGMEWFSGQPTPIVGEVLAKYGITPDAPMLEIGCGEGQDIRLYVCGGCGSSDLNDIPCLIKNHPPAGGFFCLSV